MMVTLQAGDTLYLQGWRTAGCVVGLLKYEGNSAGCKTLLIRGKELPLWWGYIKFHCNKLRGVLSCLHASISLHV